MKFLMLSRIMKITNIASEEGKEIKFKKFFTILKDTTYIFMQVFMKLLDYHYMKQVRMGYLLLALIIII